MKIAYYVQQKYAKANYKKECFNSRAFAGLLMVGDALARAGHQISYASAATVDRYDVILVSITSDCDWWPYVAERLTWPRGNYKVVVGGAGVLNVRPFLPFADAFILGRGEQIVVDLVQHLSRGEVYESPSVIYPEQFDYESTYVIAQSPIYPHSFEIGGACLYQETEQGCPNKCLFCGYTWHRKHSSSTFAYRDGLYDLTEKHVVMQDAIRGNWDISNVRTTAMDGFSERLRFMVNKRISNEDVATFLMMAATSGKPRQIKLYNIANYPTETLADWLEFKQVLVEVDATTPHLIGKQYGLILHTTPFRAMPATPAACWEMQYKNVRGEIAKQLGARENSVFHKGNSFFAVESMGTETLATVILSNIVWRGTESDTENIKKLCATKRFWSSNSRQKQATLEKYFDVADLFRKYDPDDLPTRYLKTYVPLTYRQPGRGRVTDA